MVFLRESLGSTSCCFLDMRNVEDIPQKKLPAVHCKTLFYQHGSLDEREVVFEDVNVDGRLHREKCSVQDKHRNVKNASSKCS